MSDEAPLVLVTGGTGYVGQLIAAELVHRGWRVRLASRRPPEPGQFSFAHDWVPFALDPDASFRKVLASVRHVVHAAFHHVPGRYRHGEGSDVTGFYRANVLGSVAFLEAARAAGAERAIFLSSRAVYGSQPGPLDEASLPRPDTHYGAAKLAVEAALAAMTNLGSFTGTSLRLTGVYGIVRPFERTKWLDLATAVLRDEVPAQDRAGTEVHGTDVGAAVDLLLRADPMAVAGVLTCSDLLVTRARIVQRLRDMLQRPGPLPGPAGAADVAVMQCDRLRALGWRPGGSASLEATLAQICERLTGDCAR
jgi:nucleoside-diphosphate-sugar epimerase